MNETDEDIKKMIAAHVYPDILPGMPRMKPYTPEELKEQRERTDLPDFLRIPPSEDYVAQEESEEKPT
jgi:hypothetical protein